MALLERDTEFATLQQRLDAARNGHGQLALVVGEAGIGKTSLVRELVDANRSASRVLIGSCDPLSTPRAHGPLHDIASDLGRDTVDLLRTQASNAELFPVVLTRLGDASGTIAVFEDVHWADEATLDLLRYLGRRIHTVPCLLVVTCRSDDPGTATALRQFLGDLTSAQAMERMQLQPLSEDAVCQLVGTRQLSASSLHTRTGGNPFFVNELLEAGSDLPPTVSDAVLGRWARLSPAAQQAVQIAAVIGHISDVDLISAVAGEEVSHLIDEGVTAGLMRVDGTRVEFRHELAREAVLESVTPLRRRYFHRKILANAPQLMPGADPAWLAHHASGAGDAEAILTYSVRAAERATALGANREAVLHYQHGLAASNHLPVEVRLPILEAYANATTTSGWAAEDIQIRNELVQIYRSLGDRRGETEQLRQIASSQILNGQNEAGERAIRAAMAAIEDLEEGPIHASVYATHSLILMLNRDVQEAVDWGMRAMQLARKFDDPRTVVRALNSIGSSLIVSGNLEEGSKALLEGIDLALSLGLKTHAVNLRCNLGSSCGEIFELAAAEDALEQTIEEAIQFDLDGSLSYATAWLAIVRLYQGRWDESQALAESVLTMPHPTGISRIMAFLALGRVLARRGDSGAWEALDEAQRLAAQTGTLQRIGPVAAARAEARWLSDSTAGTIEEASHGYHLAIRHGHQWLAGELNYWLQTAGKDEPPPFEVAEPYRLQRAGDWLAAAEFWERHDCPYEAARARFASDDIEQLRRAFTAFEALGARPMASRTAQRLRERGATAVPRGPRKVTRANPAGLTAREMDVLGLMAAGSTNAEIASALFLSTRTVEHHVSSILEKLAAETRREAVQSAIDRGLLPA